MYESFKLEFQKLNKIKKLPPRDQGHYLPFNTYPHGAPLGGFGAGTIGRSPYGDFNIWHIKVGAHIAEEIKACCFHLYQKQQNKTYINILSTRPYQNPKLKAFGKPYPLQGYYSASYPKSKYLFSAKEHPVEVTCEQFSPILPHNYKETSFPIAIFKHTLRNKTKENVEAAIMFTWANMTGWAFEDQRPGIQDNWFSFVKIPANKKNSAFTIKGQKKLAGVVLGQNTNKAISEMDGEIAIAALADKDMTITVQENFYLEGSGEELYKTFAKNGTLTNQNPLNMLEHQNLGSAVAVKTKLKPNEKKEIVFFLAWDLPIVTFGKGVNRYKYYTRFFDQSGKNSKMLIKIAAQNYLKWSKEINSWHEDIIKNSKAAPLFKSWQTKANYFKLLINELYFLADGGSFWDAETGSFGLLECFDYPFYETLDVRFYGSFPLLKYWPNIEKKIMEDFAKTIGLEDSTLTRFHFHAENPELPLPKDKNERLLCLDKRKNKGACPHDLGSPKDNPFAKPAAYTWQNTNYWKDLNSKFILLCWRDYKLSNDGKFLKKVWPAMQEAFEYLRKLDKDQDGIPENSGYPDQTYDNWVMTGVSAYCGSLWLAALEAMHSAALKLQETTYAQELEKLKVKASETFEQKLWNGRYYNFCTGNQDIMADQLIGQWYMDIFNKLIVPEDNIQKTLKTITRYNLGNWGIVSGKTPKNKLVAAEQGRDIWVGANFALCSLFIRHGQIKTAEKVINKMAEIIYERGFFFRTPEGWDTKGQFTATMYMRPNAIWSLEF